MVDVGGFVWVAVNGEFEEGDLEFEEFVDWDFFCFVCNYIINVSLKHLKDIDIGVNLGHILVSISRKICKS